MTDGKRTLIDTNIIIYSIDNSSDPRKRRKAKEILESGFKSEKDFYIALQSIEEFITVSTSKIENKLSYEDVYEFSEELIKLENFKILETSSKSVLKSLKIMEDGKDYWDCLIASVMIENDIDRILTENTEDFERIEGIEPVNPFK